MLSLFRSLIAPFLSLQTFTIHSLNSQAANNVQPVRFKNFWYTSVTSPSSIGHPCTSPSSRGQPSISQRSSPDVRAASCRSSFIPCSTWITWVIKFDDVQNKKTILIVVIKDRESPDHSSQQWEGRVDTCWTQPPARIRAPWHCLQSPKVWGLSVPLLCREGPPCPTDGRGGKGGRVGKDPEPRVLRREERREYGERRDAPTVWDLLLKVESSSPPEAMDPCVCHFVNCQHVSQHNV